MFLDNLRRLENLPKYDKANNVPLSELQRLAEGYGINNVWIVKEVPSDPHRKFPILKPDVLGSPFRLEGCVHIYLRHEISRNDVVQRLESWHPEIIKDLEKYIVSDRDAAYFVLLHEIGHAELGHVVGFVSVECLINEDERKEQDRAANVWGFREFQKL